MLQSAMIQFWLEFIISAAGGGAGAFSLDVSQIISEMILMFAFLGSRILKLRDGNNSPSPGEGSFRHQRVFKLKLYIKKL